MIRYYLKTALRSIAKSKFSSINVIISIALSVTAFLFILKYVMYETSYDSFHKNSDSIYRVLSEQFVNDEQESKSAYSRMALGEALISEVPGIKGFSRMLPLPQSIITFETSVFNEFSFSVESSFLTIFSINFIQGNSESALSNPKSVVISESAARKYFGTENPMGKTLKLDGNGVPFSMYFKVTGVFEDLPENSHLKYNMLFSFHWIAEHPYLKEHPWDSDLLTTYLFVKPKTNIQDLESKMNNIYLKYAGEIDKKKNIKMKYSLQPLTKIYLNSDDLKLETSSRGNSKILLFLFILTSLILMLALINFFNQITIKLFSRHNEFVVNKIHGAKLKNIVLNCISEPIIIGAISVICAIGFSSLFYGVFNEYYSFSMKNILGDKEFWLHLLLFFVFFILSIGIFFTIKYYNIKGLSATKNTKGLGRLSQNVIVYIQLILSIICIFTTLVISKQVQFMNNKGLGMSLEDVLFIKQPMVSKTNDLKSNVDIFIEELKNLSFIESATNSSFIPGYPYTSSLEMRKDNVDKNFNVRLNRFWCDYNFLETYKVKLLYGSFFKEGNKRQDCLVLNKTGAELLNFDNLKNAIGKNVVVGNNNIKMEIIGIIDDFHNQSLNKAIEPVCIYYLDNKHTYTGFMSVKFSSGDYNRVVDLLKKKWDTFFPGNPLDYQLVENYFNSQYESYDKFEKTFWVYSLLLLLIACLGLGVLASTVMKKRIYEIAIHKLFGATSLDSMLILSKNFAMIVFTSLIVSLVISFYLKNIWLKNFYYKLDIGLYFYLVPSILIICISFIVVVYQIIKVSDINPIETLKQKD